MARVCWDGWPNLGCCLDRIGAIVCKNQALKILKVVPHTHTNAETERLESCSWLLLAQVSIDLEQ